MKAITTYITEDGTSFDNHKDAFEYEKKLNKIKTFRIHITENHYYEILVSARSKDEAYDMFFKDPYKYEKKNYEISTDFIEAEEEDV